MLGDSFLFRVARALRACLSEHAPTGHTQFRRSPVQGVDHSPPTAVGRWLALQCLCAAVRRSRVVGPDGSPCSPGSATNLADLFSVLHPGLISTKLAGSVRAGYQACASARTATTRAPVVCRVRTDSAAVAPVVTMSSTTSTSPANPADGRRSRTRPATFCCRAALDSPTESRTRAVIRSAWTTVASRVLRRRGQRHPGDGVAAAPAGGEPAGGRGDDGQRRVDHAPGQQLPKPAAQRGTERPDQVGAAVFLDRHDRVAASTRVAAEREDGHAGFTRGVMRCGSSGRTRRSRSQASHQRVDGAPQPPHSREAPGRARRQCRGVRRQVIAGTMSPGWIRLGLGMVCSPPNKIAHPSAGPTHPLFTL